MMRNFTYPGTAWLAHGTVMWLTIAAVLTLTLRGSWGTLVPWLLVRWNSTRRGGVDAALVWMPMIVTERALMASCLLIAPLVLLLFVVAPLVVAVLLGGPLTVLLIWLRLWIAEQGYIARLNASLPTAVSQLSAVLRQHGFQHALGLVVATLPPGPLRAEWQYVHDHIGAPLADGIPASALRVVAALREQTPSPRHATLLHHLEVALTQPHNMQVQRMAAAAAALHHMTQRQSRTMTELAHMRYSGIALFLAGAGMAVYLGVTQWTRVTQAYSGPLGLGFGVLVAIALLGPLVGGVLLARGEDLPY